MGHNGCHKIMYHPFFAFWAVITVHTLVVPVNTDPSEDYTGLRPGMGHAGEDRALEAGLLLL